MCVLSKLDTKERKTGKKSHKKKPIGKSVKVIHCHEYAAKLISNMVVDMEEVDHRQKVAVKMKRLAHCSYI